MTLAPGLTDLLARARADLTMGVPVAVSGHKTGALIVPAETVAPHRLAALRDLGATDLAITGRRAQTLKARAYDGDVARVALPQDAGCDWIRAVADPARDLASPMKGPLASRREGDAALHRLAILLCKDARLLPAALVTPLDDATQVAANHDLTRLSAADTVPLLAAQPVLRNVVSARVPLRLAEKTRLHIFRPDNGAEEHYAVEVGRPDRDAPVLCRLHSACFTGDVLGSMKCDCGPQLDGALALMGREGAGVLLYLNQEGRGIGLANKMRTYSLQDQGFDTVEANHRLGFEDDERDFRLGSEILRRMGFRSVRLLTNNPAKIEMMQRCGIEVVERVPLQLGETPHNAGYLATKAAKSGHLL